MASPRSFNISEPQVLAQIGRDSQWMHLILLQRLEGSGDQWIALYPDGCIGNLDFTAIPFLTLSRATELPEEVRDNVVLFPFELLDEDMAPLHRRAADLARQAWHGMGYAAPVEPTTDPTRLRRSWRICQPESEFFGVAVPDDSVSNVIAGLTRGSRGLALLGGSWCPVEPVSDSEYMSWMAFRMNDPTRELRTVRAARGHAGPRSTCSVLVPPHDHLSVSQPTDRSEEQGYPHQGPASALELLQGARASGADITAHDELWSTDPWSQAELGDNPDGLPGSASSAVQPPTDPSSDQETLTTPSVMPRAFPKRPEVPPVVFSKSGGPYKAAPSRRPPHWGPSAAATVKAPPGYPTIASAPPAAEPNGRPPGEDEEA